MDDTRCFTVLEVIGSAHGGGTATLRAMAGALEGIRVLDLSSVVMGPYATQLLGDWGADVVKIDDGGSDTARHMGPGPVPGLSGVALNLLRNKRSIVIDLKTPDGVQIARQLAIQSDVVITNLRPGPLERLGLSYDDLSIDHPALIFCHAQGWSIDSGKSDRPAYDDVMQTAVGIPFLQQMVTGQPSLLPTLIADKVCGLMISNAVLAALVSRSVTGRGQRIEVPMFDTTLAFTLVEHLAAATVAGGAAGYPRILTANRRAHRTADGWIVVLPYSNAHWVSICEAVDRRELINDQRFMSPAARIMHADALYGLLGEMLATQRTEYWTDLCDRASVPYNVAHTLDEIVVDPALHGGVLIDDQHPDAGAYRRIASPVRFSETPAPTSVRPAPLPGADTDEVLADLRYTVDAIADLRQRRIVG